MAKKLKITVGDVFEDKDSKERFVVIGEDIDSKFSCLQEKHLACNLHSKVFLNQNCEFIGTVGHVDNLIKEFKEKIFLRKE